MKIWETLRTGDWLDRRRIRAYAVILLAVEIATFIFYTLGTHGMIVPLTGAISTDFGSFYAAGMLADAGTPALTYDQAAHYLAEQQGSGQFGAVYNFFFYPPVFILLCQLLALMPYLVAFVVFQLVCGLAFACCIRAIIGREATLLPFLAFPAIPQAIGLGQNSLLTAALFAGATYSIDTHPRRAGLLFGLLCYKPHFGLLVAVALLAGRHWQAIAAAIATVLGLVLLSLLVHGPATWVAFLHVAHEAPGIFDAGRIRRSGLINIFGALRLVDAPSGLAIGAQLATSALMALGVAIAWGRRSPLAGRAMVLIGATLLAMPIILFYDFTLAAVAIAWAVRDARVQGFLPWEKLGYVAIVAVALIGRGVAEGLDVPLFPLASLGLLGFAAARCRRPAAAA